MAAITLKSISKQSEPSIASLTTKSFEVTLKLPATLGRGPILKCPDKKVSRNHVMLDWDDKGILVKSAHVRPTFVVINDKEHSLTQGQSSVLNDGDSFGLLKEHFWYKVILSPSSDDNDVKKSEEIPKESPSLNPSSSTSEQNGKSLDSEIPLLEENETSDKNKAELSLSIEKQSILKADEKDELILESNTCTEPIKIEFEDIKNNDHVEEEIEKVNDRKRKLPAWLTSPAVNSEYGVKKSNGKLENRKVNKNKKNNASRASKHVISDSKLHELSESEEEVSPRKKMNSKNQNKKTPTKKQYHTVSQDFDSHDFDVENIVSKTETKITPEVNNKTDTSNTDELKCSSKEHTVSDDDDGDGDNRNEPPRLSEESPKLPKNEVSEEVDKKVLRKSCQYGKECYRKNPSHRKEMAHPGDSDYASYESASDHENDDDDDRPECEFGLNCYRKNPQHKKDFKHTKKPQPPRNAKKKAKRKDNSSQDDDYDFDDPFLNDDSSDDYAPTDTSDSDTEIEDAVDENTKRMLKEAKKFVKRGRH